MAILSGRSEWMLDTDSKIFDGATEAEFLSRSIKDVADHYGTGMLDQKTLDWMNLVQCLLIVYGGRIFAIRANPRIKPPKAPTVQETAKAHNPVAPSVHRDGASNTPANAGHVAGIGDVQLPDDHPLNPNFKPRMN